MLALLRYFSHFTLDVDNMSDEDFYRDWGRLKYALKITGQMS